MQIDIISVIPDLLTSPFEHSIMKRAKDKGLLSVNVINLRNYTTYARAQVDDYQFGGGAGMVMMIEPLVNAIEALQKVNEYDEIIYMSPDGDLFDQKMANNLSMKKKLLLICGHYKGIDQRVRDHYITKEISIGDYVLSGGELAAAVVTDAIGRLLPGVLNDESSALSDSFQDNLLAPPVYTRPENFRGHMVPEILKSGNHKLIEEWRHDESVKRTKEKRPGIISDDIE